MALKFKIIDKCWQDASDVPAGDADFLLEKDGWNDLGYHVLYHLHATGLITGKGNEYLGSIRIMKKGQQLYEIYMLEKDLKSRFFMKLPEDYVSLSSSIEMYESLSRLLNHNKRNAFIQQLHLIFDESSPFYDNSLENDDCFNKALLRDISFDNYALLRGKALMYRIATVYNLQKQKVNVSFANCENSIELNFSCLPDCGAKLIPNGVIAFIGKNGSGKSSAIYNLAKLIYASPDQRYRLKNNIGELRPNDLGISKLFVVSYSPFDNFVLPGIGGDDYRLLLQGMENGDGRFVFCGIRDVETEFMSILGNSDDSTYESLYEKLRQDNTCLKPLTSLSDEFADSMGMIEKDDIRENIWNEISGKAQEIFPEINQVMECFLLQPSRSERVEMFQSLSTGYKFFLHSLSRIIANIENDSMILFDEPENHIHPPMLSFMMASLRLILSKFQSVMLVATHSPVVLQETFAKNVFVVRNIGDSCEISHPKIETYGASISEITSEVFDLTTDVTNYFAAYETLYKKWRMDEHWKDVDDMLDSFCIHLGGRISPQLISFLISLYVEERQNN